MKEQVFRVGTKKIISQTWGIWLYALTQLSGSILIASSNYITEGRLSAIIALNAVLSILTVPGILLFRQYYKKSFKKKFTITCNTLRFEDEVTGQIKTLQSSEITEVRKVTSEKYYKIPWSDMGYVIFKDKHNNEIIVTSFMMDILDFWLSTLTREVSSDKLVLREVFYPKLKLKSK